jgi:D-tyrosyl-tRNA(Tyr) deacylase
MRAVVTRVSAASVTAEGRTVGQIGRGYLVLLGIKTGDGEAQAEKLAEKITGLRVFEDETGKMNRSLSDVGGGLLVVSQFTLYGNVKHGRRPEFLQAAKSAEAIPLYEYFLRLCRERGFPPQTGEFGAEMQVSSVNDGPVTLILDTDTL